MTGGVLKGSAPKELMDEASIFRAITRIAHEILESSKGAQDLVVIGIVTRGDVLGELLAKKLAEIEGVEVPVGSLDISFYRDDFATHAPVVHQTHVNFDLSGKTVVLVDDVLYTGRTIRAALDAIMDLGRPNAVRLAVMVDRGHRELPIRADFVGKNIPSSRKERVRLRIKPIDEMSGVYLEEA